MQAAAPELSLHVPAHNIEAEQACLGACLLDPEAVDKVAEILAASDDFYRESHQEIWLAIQSLAEKNHNVDLITVINELRSRDKLEMAGGAAYLDMITSMVQTSAHVASYARIVAERATERRLQLAGTAIARLAMDGEVEVAHKVDRAEEIVFAVADKRSRQDLVQIKPTLQHTFDQIYERFKNRRPVTGLPTGFHELDHLTAGLHPGNFIVIAARPAMGKTAFCLSIAQNVVLNREKPGVAAVFSLEMSKEELVSRVLCSTASVDAQDVRRGSLKDQDWQRITRAMNQLAEAPLFIDDTSGITVLEMKAKCRRLQKRHGLDLIIIDYLQLMRGSGKIENRVQEISDISRNLKGLAKELRVPVMALSQVGRGVESRQDKRPSLSDLRESGAIEQDADVVAFIYRDEYYNPHSEKTNIAEVILAKQRNGPVDSVELSFVKRFASFRNLEQRQDYEAPAPAPATYTEMSEFPL
ncbi:MAG: replicative DNA helicase [Candidatus Xenobia bacterium]